MGQQQLLLLVLGIVIVGIAVVAGIQAFSEGKEKAKQDAAVTDAMRIISDTQAWKLKPGAFGGGADLDNGNFTGVSLKALGYPVTSAAPAYQTTNGCYALAASTTGATLTLHQVAGAVTSPAVATCDATLLIATVTIAGTGTTSADIKWVYN
jgi:hypothetical protein